MQDDLDQALQVDVLAASLRMDRQESGDLLESLAQKLVQSLPENTTLRRGGWLLSSKHPVEEINVRFDEKQYQVVRERHGSFTCRVMKIVRGVVLKTTEIPLDQWITELAGQLAELSLRNDQMRRALNKFVIG